MSKIAKLAGMVGQGLVVPVSLILLLQAGAIYMLSMPERNLSGPGLQKLPLHFGEWKALEEGTLEPSVAEYLKPDEYILRDYLDRDTGAPINLFVAYFKSLQNNYGPHSPRVCLPGSGWLVRESSVKPVPVPGRTEGILVNEYVLEKSGQQILVMYWYQNDRSIWTEQFQAKLKLLPDLIRYRRSDVSLVRLITPMRGTSAQRELASCLDFTKQMFPALVERFAAAK